MLRMSFTKEEIDAALRKIPAPASTNAAKNGSSVPKKPEICAQRNHEIAKNH